MTRFVLAALLAPFAAGAATNSPALDLARQLNSAFIKVAEKVSPSVVVIKVAQRHRADPLNDMDNPFWNLVPREFRKQFEKERKKRKRQSEEEPAKQAPTYDGQDSNMIIRDDGYILTNFHMIEDTEKILVRLRDGRRFEGTVHDKDAQSDLAIIKINATNLPTAKLGDSSTMQIGEFAITISTPFDLDYSVTFGHVSAKGRSHIVQSFGVNSPNAAMDQDFIQTDTSINPNNSDNPLVNLYGEVIGINTLIQGLRTGIGFAMPANLAKEVSEKLIANGKFPHLWLGIGIRELRDNEDERDDVKGMEDGVLVTAIRPNKPAKNSDLRQREIRTRSIRGQTKNCADEKR